GTALREFIARFIANAERYIENGSCFIDQFVAAQTPKGAAPEIGRALRRFAVIAYAGELATELGITGWEKNEATRAVERCILDWLEQRGGAGSLEIQSAIAKLKDACQTQQYRFQAVNPPTDPSGNARPERISDRLGYWKTDDEGNMLFLLYPKQFEREI